VAQVSTMTSKKPSNYWMMTLVWFGIFWIPTLEEFSYVHV
jgi:hypothetical protein